MNVRITTDISKRLDIIARKAETFSKTIQVLNNDGTGFVFTNYSAQLVVMSYMASITPVLIFELGSGLTLSTGQILLEKDNSEMLINPKDYVYFLKITDPSDNINTWLNGKFIINQGMFDGVNHADDIVLEINGSPVTLRF